MLYGTCRIDRLQNTIDAKSFPLAGGDEVTRLSIGIEGITALDYALLGKHSRLIIDSRNAMGKVEGAKAKVVKA